MKKYTKTVCYFCKKRLNGSGRWDRYCTNSKCEKKYSYCYYAHENIVRFKINGYVFRIYLKNNKMKITLPKIESNFIVPIDEKNYLDQIDKIKVLKMFE